MSNGSNAEGISYAQIKWLERMLTLHPNVVDVDRHDDIIFRVERRSGDALTVICLDEYTCGIARVFDILERYPNIDIIYVGGVWNGYTREAKEFCLSKGIGLYNTGEMNGALHTENHWEYHKKDKEGNPTYPYKAA